MSAAARTCGEDSLGSAVRRHQETQDSGRSSSRGGVLRTSASRSTFWRVPWMRIGEHVAEYGMQGDGPYLAARDLLMRSAASGDRRPADPEARGNGPRRRAPHRAGQLTAAYFPFRGRRAQARPNRRRNQSRPRRRRKNSRRCRRTATRSSATCSTRSSGPQARKWASTCVAFKSLRRSLWRRKWISRACASHSPTIRLHACNRRWLQRGRRERHGWWASPDAAKRLYVLFVDEAAQKRLVNVLAASQAARSIVLLGDPQQLEQPMQGSHPEGTDVSRAPSPSRGREDDRGLAAACSSTRLLGCILRSAASPPNFFMRDG